MEERERLERETKKWLERLEKELSQAVPTERLDPEAIRSVMENIRAYISDCKHFMQKRDWVLAFEAITYAWGIFETCQRFGLIKKRS